jgi:phosphocarrier protein
MDPSPDATNAGPMRRKVTIANPHGFHLRPMQAFVELASQFRCTVQVWRDESEPVDGKSMLGLMLLAAEQGMELTVETDGPEAQPALDALTDLLANLQTRVPVE